MHQQSVFGQRPTTPLQRHVGLLATDPAPALQRDAYLRLLKAHDWSHEFSDDHRRWTKGREERAQLRLMQSTLDADGSLWNRFAPDDQRIRVAA